MARTFEIRVRPSRAKVTTRLKGFNQQSLDAIHFRLVQGANELRNKMINSMRDTPKTGMKYRRGKRWHIASSPGNAPAVDSGELLRSIVMNEGIDFVEVGVKSGAPHGRYLEEGTKHMKKRPFLALATDAVVPIMRRRILDDLKSMKI